MFIVYLQPHEACQKSNGPKFNWIQVLKLSSHSMMKEKKWHEYYDIKSISHAVNKEKD